MRSLLAVILLVLAALTAAAPAAAQTRAAAADLTGFVRDESNAVVSGVAITVTNPETGIVRTAVTGPDGRFLVPALSVGTYAVRAELSGFVVEDNVVLTVGSAVDFSITLRVSPIAEQITVVAAGSSGIDTQKTAVTSVVSQQQIDSLPINGRNFISFAVLTPGVNTDRSPNQGAAATSGLVFAGQRPRSNNITVDGLDNNDATVGSVRATFSQEAIREFQVLTNSYSAEFGKAAGGVLNIVTKSGTNTFAGNAFFYFRSNNLNSRGYFERFDPAGNQINLERAPYDQKQFGGTLGGPLKKDRSFFFVSFERLDIKAANLVTIDDTTSIADPRGGPPLGTPVGILRQAGFSIEIGHVPFTMNRSQFLAKADHRVTAGQQLAARFNYAGTLDENVEPWGGLIAKSRGAALNASDYTVAASHTTVAARNLVNEARGQFAFRDQTVNALDPNCPLPCTREDQGGPTIVVAGVGVGGRQLYTPGPRSARRFQALDTLSYYLGRHQLRTGFDFSFIETTARLPLGFGGQFVFAGLPAIPGAGSAPISAIQALALGTPAVYFQGYGNSDASYPYQDLSLFGQDDWTVKPNLTVKLGLRYQLQFWPDLVYDVPAIGQYMFPHDRNDMAPRLSVAWDPARDKKTVLRAAYGLFYDNNVTTIVGNTKALNGTTGVRGFVAALPSPIPMMVWNSPGHRIAVPPGDVPSLVVTVDPALETPYAHHLSAGVDHEAPRNLLLSASLVYSRGFTFLGALDYNPLVADLGPGRRPEDVGGRPGTSASISQYTSYGQTWYRGLILSVSKRQGPNQVLASYTLSEAEDNATDYIGGPENNGKGRNPADPKGLPINFDPHAERGPSVQDQRQRFVLSGSYMLPGMVQVTSIATIGSGRPYNLLAGVDFNQDGALTDRPRGNPMSARSDFSTTVGRNAGTLPAEAVVDLRIQKRVTLKTNSHVDAIFEVFNLFNRTNFTQINNTFGPGTYPDHPLPTFGQFTEAGSPRQVQLALKTSF